MARTDVRFCFRVLLRHCCIVAALLCAGATEAALALDDIDEPASNNPSRYMLRQALRARTYAGGEPGDCITFGEVRNLGQVRLWKACASSDTPLVFLGNFYAGGDTLSAARRGLLMFFRHQQPVWLLKANASEPEQLLITPDMDRQETLKMLQAAGGEQLVQAAVNRPGTDSDESAVGYGLRRGLASGVIQANITLSVIAINYWLSGVMNTDLQPVNWSFGSLPNQFVLHAFLQRALSWSSRTLALKYGYAWPDACDTGNQLARGLVTLMAMGAVIPFAPTTFTSITAAVSSGLLTYFIYSEAYQKYGLSASLPANIANNLVLVLVARIMGF